MRCQVLTDAAGFWRLSSAFLLADPVLNHVILTTIASRLQDPDAAREREVFAALVDGSGAVVGAAMRTPPYQAYISAMPPEAVETLVDALLSACPDNAGVGGTVGEADAFAAAWARRTGARIETRMRQRIHRLDEPTPPRPAAAGGWRQAGAADRDLLVRWSEAFEREAEGHVSGEVVGAVASRLAGGRAFLWESGGEPVCYAARTAAEGGVVRIGPVYTPPAHRRHGFAAALVFAIGESALAGGAERLMLYTDLANPTANRVYHRIGYRPFADVALLAFSAPPA
ncbi:MAG TPA: GNAT family N-acetyltransferase [Candidatus Dormibacteraeota bacterium]|nr:GNAT family N-acetyltransferase [Candidatus Dormibacteraeota bacterium]